MAKKLRRAGAKNETPVRRNANAAPVRPGEPRGNARGAKPPARGNADQVYADRVFAAGASADRVSTKPGRDTSPRQSPTGRSSGKPYRPQATPSLTTKGPWAATVALPERLEGAIMAGHPWVYQEQVSDPPNCDSGSWVRIVCGRIVAFALWDNDSALALRIYSREAPPTPRLIQQRVERAYSLRSEMLDLSKTNAFRWINGEGDGLPGVIVDYYAGYAVVVLDSDACEPLLPWLLTALGRCQPLRGVLRRRRGSEAAAGADERVELLEGRLPPRPLIVEEHSLRFRANVFEGQKTGLFLDHRENRHFVEQHCRGRSVLNLFSYTGGFSLYAARGGASRTVSVDSAGAAAEEARENFALNGLAGDQHEFIEADVFEYLEGCRTRGEVFDVIVCDPPSFARNQTQVKRALAAYTRVNAAALKVIADGGLYAAASCTARVSTDAFAAAVSEAARKSRRDFQLVAMHAHAADHPVSLAHPEQRYLKFLFGRVTDRT